MCASLLCNWFLTIYFLLYSWNIIMNCIREQWHRDGFDCNREKKVMRALKALVTISTAGVRRFFWGKNMPQEVLGYWYLWSIKWIIQYLKSNMVWLVVLLSYFCYILLALLHVSTQQFEFSVLVLWLHLCLELYVVLCLKPSLSIDSVACLNLLK